MGKPRESFMMPEFTFVEEHHVLESKTKDDGTPGWSTEFNKIIWNNDGEVKYDIRAWSPDHTRMGKGISLKREAAMKLRDVLAEVDFDKDLNNAEPNFGKYDSPYGTDVSDEELHSELGNDVIF